MILYLNFGITAYLIYRIITAPNIQMAIPYLISSGLSPIPLYIFGNSASAGVFAIDICLIVSLLMHGLPRLEHAIDNTAISTGIAALFAFAVFVTSSGITHYLFVDSEPGRFYAFTAVKFIEYVAIAMLLVEYRRTKTHIKQAFTVIIVAILMYEVPHILHVNKVFELSGKEYFGTRVSDYETNVGGSRGAPFSDETAWFLTSSRAVIGGTASIGVWLCIAACEMCSGKLRMLAGFAAVLCGYSVLATTSRSDIAGLAVSGIVFLFCSARDGRKYHMWAIPAATICLVCTSMFAGTIGSKTRLMRISELWSSDLREAGSYADRSIDRRNLSNYLYDHAQQLLLGAGPGNFRWYRTKGITKNAMGHNSYLHWTGELGILGGVILLAWCVSICTYSWHSTHVGSPAERIAGRATFALVIGRMTAGWGAESLFGTDGMGYYSMYFIAAVYFLVAATHDRRGTCGERNVQLLHQRIPSRLTGVGITGGTSCH